MLTRQLREFEGAGLIVRTVHAEMPPRVEYSLTAQGNSLRPVILAVADGGRNFLARGRKPKKRQPDPGRPSLSLSLASIPVGRRRQGRNSRELRGHFPGQALQKGPDVRDVAFGQ